MSRFYDLLLVLISVMASVITASLVAFIGALSWAAISSWFLVSQSNLIN